MLKLSLLGVDPSSQSFCQNQDLFSFRASGPRGLFRLLDLFPAFSGPRGLFWAFSRLLDLFPAFSGPQNLFWAFLWASGPLPSLFWPLWAFLWASGFPTFSAPRASKPSSGLFWASRPLPAFSAFWAFL